MICHVRSLSPGRARALVLVTAAIAALWFVPSTVVAQSAPPRPRIGLALGGGGARGFAHIGVLKWLVEHRIPVDLIAGTSMGGLVGGMYATGMTPAEVESLVATMQWDVILAPGTPFADKTFRRKEDVREFPSQMMVGLRGGIGLPSGLSAGQQVELGLGRMVMPYYGLANFDELPTPFRCVATDLKKAEAVVLDRGWLAQALRATMAIPGVFTPVTIGDRTLVDGGVLNNVPANVAKAMGADIVIAVDVASDLTKQMRGNSLLSVVFEALDAMMRGNTRQGIELASMVLTPDLKGLGATKFDRSDEFIKRGYATAEAHREQLEKFAVTQAEYDAYLATRAGRRRTQLPAPSWVRVEGVGEAEANSVRRRFNSFVSRPFDAEGLERQLAALMGTERYLLATYRIVAGGQGPGVVITLTPKTYGPPFLLAAVDLRNSPSTGIAATARGRVLLTDITGAGDEARIDVAGGTIMGIGAEWYRPLGQTGLFVAPRGRIEQRQFNVFDEGDFGAEYRLVTYQAGIDAGVTSGNRVEFRVGYNVEHLDGRTLVGDSLFPGIDGTQSFYSAQATYDGQTGPTVPDRGLYFKGRLRRFTRTATTAPASTSPVTDPATLLSGDVDSSLFLATGKNGRVLLRAAGGTSFGSTAVINSFTLGGPFSLGALNENELRGSHFVLANAGYLHRIFRFAQGMAGSVYAGGWIETGSAFERYSSAALKTDVSVGFIIETPVGPVSAVASVGFNGRSRFYASLGPLLHR